MTYRYMLKIHWSLFCASALCPATPLTNHESGSLNFRMVSHIYLSEYYYLFDVLAHIQKFYSNRWLPPAS